MDVHEDEPDDYSHHDRHDNLPHKIVVVLRGRPFRCLVGSFNGFQDGTDPVRNPTWHITGAEARDYLISDNLRRSGIGQQPFQPIPDFDSNFAFPNRHQQQDAVIRALLTELPGRGHSMREFFDRIAFQRRNDQDSRLVA